MGCGDSMKVKDTIRPRNPYIPPKINYNRNFRRYQKFKCEKTGYPGQKCIVYHLTNAFAGKAINDSKEMRLGRGGMYGAGIYFSDTIGKCYGKTRGGSEMAITAEISLGVSLTIHGYDEKICRALTYSIVKNDYGCDSTTGLIRGINFIELIAYRPEDVRVLSVISTESLKSEQNLSNFRIQQLEILNELNRQNLKNWQNYLDEQIKILNETLQENSTIKAKELKIIHEEIQKNAAIEEEKIKKKSQAVENFTPDQLTKPNQPLFSYKITGYYGKVDILYFLTGSKIAEEIQKSDEMPLRSEGAYGAGIYFIEKLCKNAIKQTDSHLITARVKTSQSLNITKYSEQECPDFTQSSVSQFYCKSVIGLQDPDLDYLEYIVYAHEDVEILSITDLNDLEQLKVYFKNHIETIKENYQNEDQSESMIAHKKIIDLIEINNSYFPNDQVSVPEGQLEKIKIDIVNQKKKSCLDTKNFRIVNFYCKDFDDWDSDNEYAELENHLVIKEYDVMKKERNKSEIIFVSKMLKKDKNAAVRLGRSRNNSFENLKRLVMSKEEEEKYEKKKKNEERKNKIAEALRNLEKFSEKILILCDEICTK